MKISFLSTSDSTGGAAIAARRLLDAISRWFSTDSADISLLVRQQRLKNHSSIFPINQLSFFLSSDLTPKLILEKILFSFYYHSKSVRFLFSTNRFGFPITKNSNILTSDIIHLHWINHSFISLNELNRLFHLNKPIVWTFHDMWAFTGGCHYVGSCLNYQNECGNCPLLAHPNPNDLSHQLWNHKKEIYHNSNLTIVTCSHWLAERVKSSKLLGHIEPIIIPNPINRNIFYHKNTTDIKKRLNISDDRFVLLFGAASISDKRKGLHYLIEALHLLKQNHPDLANQLTLLVVGRIKEPLLDLNEFTVMAIGSISDENEMADYYSAADAYISPSLEDNLPNTIMESLSCGTPVIAFSSGGIPEMIIHKKTGYLAEPKSAEELVNGILWLSKQPNKQDISNHAIQFVEENYSENVVAKKYVDLYQSLLSK